MTETGVVMGTVSYMSPEQALGQPVDARSDLFSFGVVLYEMATGRLPFDGTSATSVIDKILHGPPPALREVPPALEDLLLKLLEKDPADRYQSARDLVVDLRRLKKAHDLGKLETTRLRAAPSVSVRNRWLALAAVAAVAFVAGIVVHRYWPGRSGAGDTRAAPRFSTVTKFAGVEAQPAFSPDGRSFAFVSDRGGQWDLWVGVVDGGSLLRITNDTNVEMRPRWAPDGSRIAYARMNDGGTFDIWMISPLGGTPRKFLPDATDPAWSSDGRTLAYVNLESNTLWLCDATGANARAVTKPEAARFPRQPAFSRDGRRLAFALRNTGPRGDLAVVEIGTGQVRFLTAGGALVLTPAWSPDDRFIYFASHRSGAMNIWKIPSGGGQPEQVTSGQGDDAELDLSLDGKRLLFSTYRVNVDLAEARLDAPGGEKPAGVKWLTGDAARGELGPVYSPDGRRVAYFSNRPGAEVETIWTMEADGSKASPILEDGRINVYPRWTDGGQSVVYMSRVVLSQFELRRTALSGAPPETLAGSSGYSIPWGDVSADGRVVFGGPDGKARVLDAKTGQAQDLEAVRSHARFWQLRWSRDGRLLAYSLPPRRAGDPQAGAWVYDFRNPPRQVFQGWVLWQEWTHAGDLLVAQGQSDLKASLWRVRLDGSPPVKTITLPTYYSYYVHFYGMFMFDVHPDGRRIVVSMLESHEADIGMIENLVN
jgi:Tol biopolymer transport system component